MCPFNHLRCSHSALRLLSLHPLPRLHAAREATLEEVLATLCRAKELEGAMVVRRDEKKVRVRLSGALHWQWHWQPIHS